jgi:anti-anti-sigma factor
MIGSGGTPFPETGCPPPQPGVPVLHAFPSQADGEVVLTLAGDIDVTMADVVRAAARRCLRERPARLSLDLRSVTFCDAAGVRALRKAGQEAAAARAEFRIIAPRSLIGKCLQVRHGRRRSGIA